MTASIRGITPSKTVAKIAPTVIVTGVAPAITIAITIAIIRRTIECAVPFQLSGYEVPPCARSLDVLAMSIVMVNTLSLIHI